MGRGRYPARIRVAPPPAEVLARYLLVWPSIDLYRTPERFSPLSSPTLFGNERPLELEIGCATGEFLCELAACNPQVNFLGVDVARKPLLKAVHMAHARELANLKFLDADVLMIYRLMPEHAFRAVYLHFPVPNLRRRHRNRLIFTDEFLTVMQRALTPAGRISVMSDNEALFAEMLAVARTDSRFRLVDPAEYALQLDETLKSHYHRVWERRGRLIQRFELARND